MEGEDKEEDGDIYLMRLPAEGAIGQWSVIKEMLRLSSTKRNLTDQELTNIQRSVASSTSTVWLIRKGEENVGVFLTSIRVCPTTGQKTLLIIALYGLSYLKRRFWEVGIGTLKDYCLNRGISTISAYSNHPSIIRRLEALGADTSYRHIEFTVGDEK